MTGGSRGPQYSSLLSSSEPSFEVNDSNLDAQKLGKVGPAHLDQIAEKTDNVLVGISHDPSLTVSQVVLLIARKSKQSKKLSNRCLLRLPKKGQSPQVPRTVMFQAEKIAEFQVFLFILL